MLLLHNLSSDFHFGILCCHENMNNHSENAIFFNIFHILLPFLEL